MERDEPLRVVVFQDGGLWVAQCLDYDIGAQGQDLKEVSARLNIAIEAERRESQKRYGEDFAGIPRAPQKYFEMYEGSSGKLHPKGDGNYDMAMCAQPGMSAPFGEHPTLADYMTWAQGKGCAVSQGVMGAHSVTKIVAPDGNSWVMEVGTQHFERLPPTTVARLDRRLGLNSPFPSLSDESDSE